MDPPAEGILSRPKRWLLTGAGLVSLGLGAAGALLPLLPTTPFVLLAAFCFARSSPRLHRWLREHRWFGPPLEAWERHGSVPRKTKLQAFGLLWTAIPVSILLIDPLWARALLGLVLLIASLVVWRLPTLEADPPQGPGPLTSVRLIL